MPPLDSHDWIPNPAKPYFSCRVCRISGKQIGSAWPPVRDPKFILLRTCDEVKEAQVNEFLKKRGLL